MITKTSKPLYVIGIGASAGGLKALQSLVSGLNKNTNCSYVVAQHLSTNHESNMVNLLAKYTEVPIKTAENGVRLSADVIYVCPENANIVIESGHILLTPPEDSQTAVPSINSLFESIAHESKDRAMGVILSGVGSDGAEGAKSIIANNGQIIAQDLHSAQYDGMVKATMNATQVNHFVSPQKIGDLLTTITT